MNGNFGNERRHAVVIGGSIAGLLAARVLADFFDRVTLVERDALPGLRQNRRGVPQDRHTHGLLASGRQVLETFFPGISNEAIAAGAVPCDTVRQGRWFMEGGCHARFPSGIDGLLMSRPFLEGFVRERVRNLPNVCLRDRQGVSGLLASADKTHVTGVTVGEESIPADLVVDTTGRGSRSPQWLEAMGYRQPEEERVEIALQYTTRFFRRLPEHFSGDLAAVIPSTPSGKRGGVMLAQEQERWTVTLISHFGTGAPAELAGFVEFARGLPAPWIYEVIRNAEPVSEAFVSRFPASMRRRYEKLSRFPRGYLVMGDAMSSFNPAYGQGMSVAALEAVELQKALGGGTRELAKRFFVRASKVIDTPWSIAVGNDLRMPEAIGARTRGVRFVNGYMAQLHQAAHHDPTVALAFHRVANLLAPPRSILNPRIAARVLWASIGRVMAPVTLPRAISASASH